LGPLDQSMFPEAHDNGAPALSHDGVTPTGAIQKPLPGLISGIGSMICGVFGFGVPVVGMVAACIGIWLGIRAIRQGRMGDHMTSVVCGAIGITVSALSIVFWVCAVLFESYH
jgi:hypothetical protein